MNDKTFITKPSYNLTRIWRKVYMVVAKLSLLSSAIRVKCYKMGGVKGKCFIGSNVQFDGIYPNFIESGEGCVITSGTIILSHFIIQKIEGFMQVE